MALQASTGPSKLLHDRKLNSRAWNIPDRSGLSRCCILLHALIQMLLGGFEKGLNNRKSCVKMVVAAINGTQDWQCTWKFRMPAFPNVKSIKGVCHEHAVSLVLWFNEPMQKLFC